MVCRYYLRRVRQFPAVLRRFQGDSGQIETLPGQVHSSQVAAGCPVLYPVGVNLYQGGSVMSELLKASDLARVVGVSRSVVYQWVKLGLPVVRAPGVGPRYRLESVRRWLDQYESGQVPADRREVAQGAPRVSAPAPASETLPKGVMRAGPGRRVLMIAYAVPGPDPAGKTRRVRESSGVTDPMEAARVRRDRLRAAWMDAPDCENRRRFIAESEGDV